LAGVVAVAVVVGVAVAVVVGVVVAVAVVVGVGVVVVVGVAVAVVVGVAVGVAVAVVVGVAVGVVVEVEVVVVVGAGVVVAMITVDVFLLNGHAPSANVLGIVDLYLDSCPGVVLRKQTVQSRKDLAYMLYKHKLKNLPALKHGKEVLYKQTEIEQFCKELVQQMSPVNRRKR